MQTTDNIQEQKGQIRGKETQPSSEGGKPGARLFRGEDRDDPKHGS